MPKSGKKLGSGPGGMYMRSDDVINWSAYTDRLEGTYGKMAFSIIADENGDRAYLRVRVNGREIVPVERTHGRGGKLTDRAYSIDNRELDENLTLSEMQYITGRWMTQGPRRYVTVDTFNDLVARIKDDSERARAVNSAAKTLRKSQIGA